MQVEGFGVDFVSWGHYRPSVWRNHWHSHSFFGVPRICRDRDVPGRPNGAWVGPSALFVARPGQVHEIESTSTDPFVIVFWGFTLRPVARSARLEERGWRSALVDETRPSVSIRVGAIPELVDASSADGAADVDHAAAQRSTSLRVIKRIVRSLKGANAPITTPVSRPGAATAVNRGRY